MGQEVPEASSRWSCDSVESTMGRLQRPGRLGENRAGDSPVVRAPIAPQETKSDKN